MSLAKASKKIKEHYGIDISISAIRNTTLNHARNIKKQIDQRITASNKRASKKEMSQRAGSPYIISETDGSMVPVVVTRSTIKDNRKHKQVMYREARLTLAYAIGSVTPIGGTRKASRGYRRQTYTLLCRSSRVWWQ